VQGALPIFSKIHNVAYLLRARTVKPEETAVTE
jgi:hypothetical protein